jgi:ABC-type polysaccharide/polyol phosphate export permease
MDVYSVDRTRKRSALDWLNPLIWGRKVRRDLSELFRDRHVISYQVMANLKVRYQHSFLGVLWSLLNPILMLAVLAVVFSEILQRRTLEMTFYIFSGLVPFQFFNTQINQGSLCLLKRAGLLNKLRLNKLVFPMAGLVDGLVTLGLTLVALILLLAIFLKMPLLPQMALVPLCMLILAAFTFGLSLLMMVLVIYFRDLEHILSVVLRALYFMSPVLYRVEWIKTPGVNAVINLNPMTHMLILFRCCLTDGQWPTVWQWLIPTGIALVMLGLGYAAYKLREDDLIFRL